MYRTARAAPSARRPDGVVGRAPERLDELVRQLEAEDVRDVLRVRVAAAELARADVGLEELGLDLGRIDALGEDAVRVRLVAEREVEPDARVVLGDLAHLLEVLLVVLDRVEERRRRGHEGLDDV